MFTKINFTDRAVVTVVRILMLLAFTFYIALIGVSWTMALLGDSSLIFDLADIENLQGPLSLWKYAIGISISFFTLSSIGLTFFAVHNFFSLFLKNQFFSNSIADAIRNIAFGLIGFWIGTILFDSLLPFVLTYGYDAGKTADIELLPLDPEMIFGVVGITLLAVAVLLKRGHAIQEENQQII